VAHKQVIEGLFSKTAARRDSLPPSNVSSLPYLRAMLQHALDNYTIWPADKTSRWIGYVQGVLTARGLLDVTSERERTRKFFHEAYQEMGLDIPPSVNLNS